MQVLTSPVCLRHMSGFDRHSNQSSRIRPRLKPPPTACAEEKDNTLLTDSFQDMSRDSRLGLLNDPEFTDWLAATNPEFTDAAEYLGLGTGELSRADKCLSPVVLDRVAESTGEKTELVLPCGSPNSHKCAPCAEFAAKMRMRQVLTGFEKVQDGTRVALFTLTAPSFGKVHRASITAKDEYKRRNMAPPVRDASLRELTKTRDACICGKHHRWDEDLIGTPLKVHGYGYADEAIWSKNLPNLVRSTNRRLRYLAKNAGIDKDDLATFGVFERQKRGALHFHCLVVVRENSAGFDHLAREVKNNWESPTSLIPDHILTWLKSSTVAERWQKYAGHLPEFDPASSIPLAKWKGGKVVPATTWGPVNDWSEVTPHTNMDGDEVGVNGWMQVAGYVAKYLTKSQTTSALAATRALPFRQSQHFKAARAAAGALFADLTVVESKIDAINRELDRVTLEIQDASTLPENCSEEYEAEILHHLDTCERYAEVLVAELRECGRDLDNPRPQRIITSLFDSFNVEVSRMKVGNLAASYGERLASRGLAIRLNKLLDNAGFTGSLTSVSQWGCTLTDLKNAMEEYVRSQGGFIEDPETYAYELNTVSMREKTLRRVPYSGKTGNYGPRFPPDAPGVEPPEDLLQLLQTYLGAETKLVEERQPGVVVAEPLFY